MSRIVKRFDRLKRQGRAGLVTCVTADDPGPDLSRETLKRCPGSATMAARDAIIAPGPGTSS